MDNTVNMKNSREEIGIAVTAPLSPVPKGTTLAVFANNRPYVPFHETRQMLSVCASYARKNNVYLVPERFAVNDYLCLCIMDPKGEPCGLQKSCHLSLSDRGTFFRDFSLDITETPFGKIALLPSVDMNIPYVLSEAEVKGAELLVGSLFIESYDFSPKRATFYAENAARATGIPIAASLGNGGVIISGDRTVAAPYGETSVFGKVTPTAEFLDKEALKEGAKLLLNHKNLFVYDERREDDNA